MPVVRGEGSGITFPKLEAREWRNTVGQSGMTPTAFAFLIPVFVVVVFFPFLCIFFIRKRRRASPVVSTRPKKPPALRRAEARERLNSVTEESRVADTPTKKAAHNASTTETREVAASNTSISDQECAICLSTLHAPSPPEPVALTTQPPSDDAAARPPSINDPTPEVILKLNTCGHEFHAECLVSWVVLRKTSCPICRSIYITKEQMTQYDEEAEIASESLAAADAEMANTNAVPVRNWRYFLYGNRLWGQQPVVVGAPAYNMART